MGKIRAQLYLENQKEILEVKFTPLVKKYVNFILFIRLEVRTRCGQSIYAVK
jgi:hypothetical protein